MTEHHEEVEYTKVFRKIKSSTTIESCSVWYGTRLPVLQPNYKLESRTVVSWFMVVCSMYRLVALYGAEMFPGSVSQTNESVFINSVIPNGPQRAKKQKATEEAQSKT